MKKKDKSSIDPRIVYFTHSKIRGTFTGCNKRIQDTLEQILSKKITVEDIPAIKILFDGEKYYSQNNRRLFLFKTLADRGLVGQVPCTFERLSQKQAQKMRKNTYSLTAKIALP